MCRLHANEVSVGSALRSAGSQAYTVGVSTIEPSYRYIVRTPGVRGGHARVDGTRIGVHDVIGLLQNGETIDSLIATCFPGSHAGTGVRVPGVLRGPPRRDRCSGRPADVGRRVNFLLDHDVPDDLTYLLGTLGIG